MANTKNQTQHNIIMFRLKKPSMSKLAEVLKREHVAGVRSTNQYARKIVRDFLNGRLAYANPKDRLVDSELLDPEG